MPPHMCARPARCGVFLYELVLVLVPSDDPFIWCLCETHLFCGHSPPQRTFFISSEKQIKFATSTTATAVQSKSNSHVSVYYQPVEFTSFCQVLPCVFAVLFLRRRRSCLKATIWAHSCSSDLLCYCGVVGVVVVLVPPRWCQNDAQQVFTK
jgi:hypothetical protein